MVPYANNVNTLAKPVQETLPHVTLVQIIPIEIMIVPVKTDSLTMAPYVILVLTLAKLVQIPLPVPLVYP